MRRRFPTRLFGLPAVAVATLLAWSGGTAAAAEEGGFEPGRPKTKTVDRGPPLVDNVAELKRLHPTQPVWLDAKHKRVIFMGDVCRANYGLEFLVTLPDRGYESVIVSDVKASIVHTGLIAAGAEPGHPASFQPKFTPASGTEVEIQAVWKDKDGKRQQVRAQELIRDTKTKKSPSVDWVFGGSGFSEADEKGKRYYQADAGDFIAVSNVPIATLDFPIESGTAIESRLFEGNPDRLPPQGTPVTLILAPKVVKAKP